MLISLNGAFSHHKGNVVSCRQQKLLPQAENGSSLFFGAATVPGEASAQGLAEGYRAIHHRISTEPAILPSTDGLKVSALRPEMEQWLQMEDDPEF